MISPEFRPLFASRKRNANKGPVTTMIEELTQEFWNQFTRDDWENPKGAPVAMFVLNRYENDTSCIRLAEKACKAAGADWEGFITHAGGAVSDAIQADKQRGIKPPEPPPEPVKTGLTCLASIEPKKMEWLWHPYIPAGAMTIIQGDPGCGKTYLATWLSKLITTGGWMPGSTKVQPGSVIFQSMEDGLAEGLVPRLITAGCDMSKIHAFDESDQPLQVQDLARIEAAFKAIPDLKMFVVDPIQSYLGAKVDINKANEIRAALKGLLNLCNQQGVALVLIGHMGKSQNKDLYRLIGSMDFVAQARSVLMVGENQAQPGERVVLPIKTSNAKKGEPFAYQIAADGVEWLGFRPGFTQFDMKHEAQPEGDNRVDEAARFVLEALEDKPLTVKEMDLLAKQADLKPMTLRRAREELKDDLVISLRKVGRRGAWYWYIRSKKIAEVDQVLIYLDSLDQVDQVLETPAAVGLVRDQSNDQVDQVVNVKPLTTKDVQEDQQGQDVQDDQDDQSELYPFKERIFDIREVI